MKTSLSLFLILCLIFREAECAKRIDVKKRMTEGLAKRDIDRRPPTQDETKSQRDLKPVEIFQAKKRSNKIDFGEQQQKSRRDVEQQEEEIKEVEDTLGLQKGEHLSKADGIRTPAGRRKEKLIETYKGLPVLGEGVVVELDTDGHITGDVEGNLIEGIAEDVPYIKPRLTLQQALKIAVREEGDQIDEVFFKPNENGQLVIYVAESVGDNVQAFLAWQLSYLVEGGGRVSRPFYVVEATDGTILESYQGITMAGWRERKRRLIEESLAYERAARDISYLSAGVGGNSKTGIKFYGKGSPSLEVTMRNGTCYLENTIVKVLHMNSSDEEKGDEMEREAYSFECGTGNIDLANEAFSPVNDAYFYANAVYDMYTKEYGIEPLQGKIVARIHFGTNFENAFWDGRVITFGDGESTFYPLVTMDIMAHELGHGFTEQHSGLVYSGQSGALNEAFSDMAGETAKALVLGQNDWLLGYEATKDKDTPLRFMDHPSKDNRSIGNAGDYCPGIDVHYSSGVFNRAFYLLTNTEGWDIWTAFDVFLTANRMYWTRSTNYVDGACGVKQAAIDWGYNVEDVMNAFKQVGIVPCEPITKGFVSMYELFAEDNETITFTVDVPPGLEYVRFETSVSETHKQVMDWMKEKHNITEVNNVDLKVTAEGFEQTSAGNTSDENIEIPNPTPGRYTVELVANPSFSSVTALAVAPNRTLAENVAFSGRYYNLTFELNEVGASDMAVEVGVICPRNFSVVGYIRYDEPVNIDDYEYDYWLYRRQTDDEFVRIRQVLICNAKPGEYYLTLNGYNNNVTDLTVFVNNVLRMQRVEN